MTDALATIRDAIRVNWRGWLLITVSFVIVYYCALLLSMVYRFGHWPNYVTGYNWFGNVATIIVSTPSLSDMVPIIMEEWLLEVGYMNMSFGHGISEWSLNLIPSKMLAILLLGMMISTVWALQTERSRVCQGVDRSALAATGVGSAFVALTGATMSWVVCCATPSWIVGLAMLGMGVATANWLEPLGTWIALAGFSALAFAIYSLSQKPSEAGFGKSASGYSSMTSLSGPGTGT